MLGREDQIVLSAAPRHDGHALGADRIQHRERVAHRCPPVVGPYIEGAVRTPVATPVERHHPAMTGEVGNLELPRPGVDDFPGWQEQDGGLALAVRLVVDPDPITLGIAAFVRVTRPRLLAGRSGHLSIHRSIHSRSPWCLVSMPPKRSTMMPRLNATTSTSAILQPCTARQAVPDTCPIERSDTGTHGHSRTSAMTVTCIGAGLARHSRSLPSWS